MIGTSGSFLAGSGSEKGGCFLLKNIIGIKHNRNDLVSNIANIFLQLRCEIFVGEKRNQVEADNHVFYNMQIKPSVSKSQFEAGGLLFFLSVRLQVCRGCPSQVSEHQHQQAFFSMVCEASLLGLVP